MCQWCAKWLLPCSCFFFLHDFSKLFLYFFYPVIYHWHWLGSKSKEHCLQEFLAVLYHFWPKCTYEICTELLPTAFYLMLHLIILVSDTVRNKLAGQSTISCMEWTPSSILEPGRISKPDWPLLYSDIPCFQANTLNSSYMRLWMSYNSFTWHVLEYPPKWCTYVSYNLQHYLWLRHATQNCCHLHTSPVYTVQPCTHL